MIAAYRCECGRTLCAIEEEMLLIKRKGLMALIPLAEGAAYIRCDSCATWHALTNSRIMEPMTDEQAEEKLGKRCISCGQPLPADAEGRNPVVCPNCGQSQTLTNPTHKQTRSQ